MATTTVKRSSKVSNQLGNQLGRSSALVVSRKKGAPTAPKPDETISPAPPRATKPVRGRRY